MAKSNVPTQSADYARQEKALAKLPKNFRYPLFNGWQAIQSQRKSAYKSTARAAREIVDNAIEAGAKNVWVVFDLLEDSERKAHQRKNTVTAIAFIDDGPGMVHHDDQKSMLRYAMSWGGGSHFDDPNFIGKFGFGLPNSSVNQTQYTEVFTRTTSDKAWNKGVLDIRREAVPASGEVNASPVVNAELPAFVSKFLADRKIELKTGTVVVWHNPDRLTVSLRATLREHLAHDFQVVYRGLLDRTKLFVDSDEPLFHIDPLFLDPKGWLFEPSTAGGALCLRDETLVVKRFYDSDSGQPHLQLVGPEKGHDPVSGFTYDLSLEDANAQKESPPPGQRDVAIASIRVRVSYLPYPNFIKWEKKKIVSDAGRRFDIRKRSRGISFVRAGREIDTQDVFPKDNREEKGVWPLLQSYAYYWGLEVAFDPSLDDCMGIGHDKQTVEPIEDFWRVLHGANIDNALVDAGNRRRAAGKTEKEAKKLRANADQASIEAANQVASQERPTPPESPKSRKQQEIAEEQAVAEAVEKAAEKSGESSGKATASAEAGSTAAADPSVSTPTPRFALEFFDAAGGVFMEPRAGVNGQVIIAINRQHPWHAAYANASDVVAARNATNLLLFALGAAEVRAKEAQQVWLEALRCDNISVFLRKTTRLMTILLPDNQEEEEE